MLLASAAALGKALCVLQVHDRMTEQVYTTPLKSFGTDVVPTPVFTVPIMEQGTPALEQINEVCFAGLTSLTCSTANSHLALFQ